MEECKEDMLLKKVLLDNCTLKASGLNLLLHDTTDPIVIQIKKTLLGTEGYPHEIKMLEHEKITLRQIIQQYSSLYLDAFVANSIFRAASQFEFLEAIRMIFYNYQRLQGF
mmetsp:Transcript_3687/g.3622  ORF Transcript_3687/g.3622 Transcript_3687/m.3622 type:complete len:111 (+) Transcript_3687:853-1185(+)